MCFNRFKQTLIRRRLHKGASSKEEGIGATLVWCADMDEAKTSRKHVLSFLEAGTVVLVGASSNPKRSGYIVARSLIRYFQGQVHYVTPTENRILGYPALPSIDEVPEGRHLWIFSAILPSLPEMLCQLADRKPQGVLLLVDPLNRQREELAKAIGNLSCPVIGPRSVGIYYPKTALDSILALPEVIPRPPAGGVGVISDNRDVALGLLDQLSRQRCGVSCFVDLGDALGLDESDLLESLARDRATSVILLGCGQIARPKRFAAAARRARRAGKPIITPILPEETMDELKVRRRLAPEMVPLTKEFAQQHGLTPTSSWEQAVDLARLCQWQPLPQGPRVAVVSNFGPYCIDAANALHNSSLELAPFDSQLISQLETALPPHCRAANPICLYSSADELRLDTALRPLLPDPSIHILLLSLLPESPYIDPDYLKVMLSQRLQTGGDAGQKTVVAVVPAREPDNLLTRCLEELHIPVYPNAHRAVAALEIAHTCQYQKPTSA